MRFREKIGQGFYLIFRNILSERDGMRISVEYSIEVQAKAEKLWEILTDVESWPSWQGTPFVKLSKPCRIIKGSTFVAVLGGSTWHLVVTKAERPHKIVWEGRCLGLKGVHEWEFVEDKGKTKVTTRETMTGWMLFIIYPITKKRLSHTDEKWLADFKLRAESS